jgi:hypothetical protein
MAKPVDDCGSLNRRSFCSGARPPGEDEIFYRESLMTGARRPDAIKRRGMGLAKSKVSSEPN